jgi:CRP-like cAMP-binding protein
MTVQESVLEKHPFFEGIATPHIHQVARLASNASFEAERLIFRRGEPARQFYIITQGKVALEVFAHQRGPLTLMTIEDDDVLGWSWLFEPYVWQFDARALEDTRTIALDAEALREQCEHDYELGYHLMRRLLGMVSRRLIFARMQQIDMYSIGKRGEQ